MKDLEPASDIVHSTTNHVTVRLYKDEWDAFDKLAEKANLTSSGALIQILRMYLESRDVKLGSRTYQSRRKPGKRR